MTGAILAGGASRRMGRPKQELTLPDGRTMVDAVGAALRPLCDDVVVVGAGGPIADLRAGEGPLAGIEALLESDLDDAYLVCPCDVPLMTADLLGRLVAAPGPAAVFRVAGEPGARPLPMRLPAAALESVQWLLDRGHRAVQSLLPLLGATEVVLTTREAAPLANVNTPQDWEAIRDAIHPS